MHLIAFIQIEKYYIVCNTFFEFIFFLQSTKITRKENNFQFCIINVARLMTQQFTPASNIRY